jgi:NADH-quinone oxidoreductase subunit J
MQPIKPFLQSKRRETGGMLEDILQYILMVVTIILALAVIELKNLLYAAIAFCGMCIAIGGIFWLLYAPYAAVFQVLIYAGAVVTIFLAAVMLTTRKESMK